MPTDTITIEDLKKRHEDTAKDYQEAMKQQEANRLNSPATVEQMETVIARLDGLHYQSINNLKYLAEFKTELEKAKAFIDSAKVTVDKSKMSITDKLWVVALGAWIVLLALEIGKFF
jgi:hypothetical protein